LTGNVETTIVKPFCECLTDYVNGMWRCILLTLGSLCKTCSSWAACSD
jgi:hypothetical protein